MLYVVRELYLPTGERLCGWVVDIADGCVVSIFPFERELPSMCFFDEIFLSYNSDALNIDELRDAVPVDKSGERLYAYSRVGNSFSRL